MDLKIKEIVKLTEQFDRETIFIFQSDNGGATQKFPAEEKTMRACNFPYKAGSV